MWRLTWKSKDTTRCKWPNSPSRFSHRLASRHSQNHSTRTPWLRSRKTGMWYVTHRPGISPSTGTSGELKILLTYFLVSLLLPALRIQWFLTEYPTKYARQCYICFVTDLVPPWPWVLIDGSYSSQFYATKYWRSNSISDRSTTLNLSHPFSDPPKNLFPFAGRLKTAKCQYTLSDFGKRQNMLKTNL